MPKLDIFPACRMKAFAALVSRELGVQVRLRGRDICVRYGKPPTIFLPNLEMAREQDLLPLYGFCLHEAAHLCYTDPKVVRRCPNYMLKMLHNAIEDVFIEGRLERAFPGARDMLIHSYVEGVQRVMEGQPVVREQSYLAPESRDDVIAVMRGLKMDDSDTALVNRVARRLELDRAAKLWLVARRGYPLALFDWPSHPWRQVFEEETSLPARSTRQGYAQAERIAARLGIEPVFPDDVRPVEVIRESEERRAAARTARRALLAAKRKREEEIRGRCMATSEHRDLQEKSGDVKAAEEAVERAQNELAESNKAGEVAGAEHGADEARKALAVAQGALNEAREVESEASEKYKAKRGEIVGQVRVEHAAGIAALKGIAKQKSADARVAADAAVKALAQIKVRDEIVDASIEKEKLEKLIGMLLEQFKEQDVSEELAEALNTPAAIDPSLAPARKYCPFDRSLDRVDRIQETPLARAEYERARVKHEPLIRETTERLRRLRAPQKTRLKVNAERGRLDPRKAYQVGLGLRGAPVDLSKVWRTTVERNDAKVAVSLLIDCSGSMAASAPGGETRIGLARQAAMCLSEVLTGLKIPYEIVGHTTREDAGAELDFMADDSGAFSRFIPFQGYVFKQFGDTSAPASLYADFESHCNVDGEALLWASGRLAARSEKTKLLIVISDGMPAAAMSNIAELERHLYVTCKQIEAKESEGLHLAALGICEERVKTFYKNADVINAVGDLPVAVLRIVERVMSDSRYTSTGSRQAQ